MTDRKNIITLGIGAGPGKVLWFITGGLEGGAEVVVVTNYGHPIALPGVIAPIQLPAMSLTAFTLLEERAISDGDTRVMSDGETRMLVDAYANLFYQIVPVALSSTVMPVSIDSQTVPVALPSTVVPVQVE